MNAFTFKLNCGWLGHFSIQEYMVPRTTVLCWCHYLFFTKLLLNLFLHQLIKWPIIFLFRVQNNATPRANSLIMRSERHKSNWLLSLPLGFWCTASKQIEKKQDMRTLGRHLVFHSLDENIGETLSEFTDWVLLLKRNLNFEL